MRYKNSEANGANRNYIYRGSIARWDPSNREKKTANDLKIVFDSNPSVMKEKTMKIIITATSCVN